VKFSELRDRITGAARIGTPHESARWPRWVVVAANTITRDPRDLTDDARKREAFLELLRVLRSAGPGTQEALIAADALGGDEACVQFVDAIVQEHLS
jgi:hypothetical protein